MPSPHDLPHDSLHDSRHDSPLGPIAPADAEDPAAASTDCRPVRRPPAQPSRRRVLTSVLALGTVAGVLGVHVRQEKAAALPTDRIRPPGALAEPAFLDACIRCGLCVQACPYEILHLAGMDEAMAAGTPYFIARSDACRMCADIPCVPACPTGALDGTLLDITRARMGTAQLSDPRRCMSYSGAGFCRACYQACPLADRAIRMQYGRTEGGGLFQPVVDPNHCTGCGLCEQACIVEGTAAITVLANHEDHR